MSNIIRLGDYITEICEKTTVNNQYMVLTSSQEGIVSQDDYFNKQVASKDNTGYKVIHRGQFTYRAMSDTGRFYINRLCDYDTGIVSPAYPVFELKKNEDILPDYLQEYFHSEQFQNSIVLSSTGSTRVSLKLSKIADLRIAVPSISDQRHMVIAIQHVSNLISVQNSALCKLDELVKSRFIELFGSPDSNEKGLSTLPMTDLCEIIDGDRGKNYPKQEEFSEEGFCLFLNAKNVTSNGFSFENCMYITEEKDKNLRNGKLNRGDVVLTTRGTLGNLAFYDESVPYTHMRINSGMVILRMKRDRITERFFIEQFKMQLASIKERIASGSAQPQLPISTMNKIVMLVPDVELQNQFAAFVVQVDKSKFAVQQSIEKLETLKKSLMQQYFG